MGLFLRGCDDLLGLPVDLVLEQVKVFALKWSLIIARRAQLRPGVTGQERQEILARARGYLALAQSDGVDLARFNEIRQRLALV